MAVVALIACRRTLTQACEVIAGLEWAEPTALDDLLGEPPTEWRAIRVMWWEPWLEPPDFDYEPF